MRLWVVLCFGKYRSMCEWEKQFAGRMLQGLGWHNILFIKYYCNTDLMETCNMKIKNIWEGGFCGYFSKSFHCIILEQIYTGQSLKVTHVFTIIHLFSVTALSLLGLCWIWSLSQQYWAWDGSSHWIAPGIHSYLGQFRKPFNLLGMFLVGRGETEELHMDMGRICKTPHR